MTDEIAILPTTSANDELVVDMSHVDLVTARLALDRISVDGEPEYDDELGLALLKLTEPDPDQLPLQRPVTDLDPVLRTLRDRFRDEYGDWVPMMGKNRDVETVIGFPQPQSMGAGSPVPVDSFAPPRTGPLPDAGRNVRVGVLDTAIYPHPDLVGRFTAEREDLLAPSLVPVPLRSGHATFVTSVVLAHAGAATVDARAVLRPDGRASTWETVRAMMTFARSGVDVLNLSLGCRTSDGKPPLLMARAVQLLSRQMLIVAAAGNHGEVPERRLRHAPTWPAALPDVVAVGARDTDDRPAEFSPRLPWVTCTAPGVDVTGDYLTGDVTLLDGTAQPFKGYASWSGTSFATATVSGAIAAGIVPGSVSARESFQRLLNNPDGVVRKYLHEDDPDA